ncbi:MAG: hypothetical protein U0Z26_09220 [Anaerolineales bacterium]
MAGKKEDKTNILTVVLPAVITAIVGIIGATLSYKAGLNQITIPLNATQTAEARQSLVSQPSETLTIIETPAITNQEIPIEQIPATIYLYASDNVSQEIKSAITNELKVVTGLESGVAYKQIFSFPDNTKGGGLYFKFSPELDIIRNEYQAVAFTINVNPEIKMQFILSGSGDDDDGYVDLNSSTYGAETGVKVNNGDYYIPLAKNFSKVSKVKWLYFWIDSSNTSTSGTIEYEVSNLRFIK